MPSDSKIRKRIPLRCSPSTGWRNEGEVLELATYSIRVQYSSAELKQLTFHTNFKLTILNPIAELTHKAQRSFSGGMGEAELFAIWLITYAPLDWSLHTATIEIKWPGPRLRRGTSQHHKHKHKHGGDVNPQTHGSWKVHSSQQHSPHAPGSVQPIFLLSLEKRPVDEQCVWMCRPFPESDLRQERYISQLTSAFTSQGTSTKRPPVSDTPRSLGRSTAILS